MDYLWPQALTELQGEVTAFVERWERDTDVREDSWLAASSRAFDVALAQRGWLGMTWPKELGGHARSELERFAVVEALVQSGAPVAGSWFADRQIGPVLLQFGTEQQQKRWIPEIAAGRSRWCVGMSEPDAGSDVASIRTAASRQDGDFVVNGQKVWTSGAFDADWCYLVCRTDPDAPPHKGLTELVVDMKSPGVTVRTIRDASGAHHFCEIFFENVLVPEENQVGTLNGSFSQLMRQLEHERGGIERLVSNRALYQWAVAHCDAANGLVRQEVAALEIGYRIGRHMILRNIVGPTPPAHQALTKILGTEFEQRVASFIASVAGMDATLSNRISRNLVYSPAYTLMGGTTQILRNVVGERYLGLPR
jgi:alkylation response protein AidB-like acyl-CoA dehydrogenase